uniref:Uncharacterized protein n=1 Tax=Spongospora subterranea TaxID=70186 RepID=A0A0H5QKA9_9EUKA|eukprot:CRZ02560.1 hypothetical protein [Spongospora subterranea]
MQHCYSKRPATRSKEAWAQDKDVTNYSLMNTALKISTRKKKSCTLCKDNGVISRDGHRKGSRCPFAPVTLQKDLVVEPAVVTHADNDEELNNQMHSILGFDDNSYHAASEETHQEAFRLLHSKGTGSFQYKSCNERLGDLLMKVDKRAPATPVHDY